MIGAAKTAVVQLWWVLMRMSELAAAILELVAIYYLLSQIIGWSLPPLFHLP
jgi:hypothetical protein